MIIIFFLFHSFVSAQDSTGQAKRQSASIVFSKGAYIYSTDENFNKQILSNKIVLENAEVSHDSGKNNKILIKSTSDSIHKKKQFPDQLQNAVKKKRKEAQNTINKKIKEFEEKKKLFQSQQFNPAPFTGKFLAGHQIFKDYITPPYHYDYSKMGNRYHRILITLALDYLHAQKYIHYNNKSLDHCFSKVFSVRPPPVLVS